MKEKVTNKLEKRAAEVIMITMLIAVLLSSCGASMYTSCPGVDGGRASGCGNAWSAR